MEHISRRVQALSVSQTLAMAQKSREMKEQGIDVISLSLGEPDFNTPDDIKEAAKKAIDDNYSFYPPVPGYGDLREAISRKFREENGLEYSPDQIIVSAGGKHSLINVMLSVVDPGEEVILLAPYWVSYLDHITFAEGKPVIIKTNIESNFKVTPAQLEEALSPRTRVLIFNSPSNPTGMVYTRDEMAALVRVLEKFPQVIIISDEIYEHIIFSGKHISLASFSSIYDRVVTINGVSKGYAMTGWRIGYMGAPLWLAKACNKLQGQFTSGVSSIAQRAALAAVTSKSDSKERMREAFLRRRDLICSLLKEIPGLKVRVPQGAFYVMPDISNFIGRSYNGKVMKNSDDLTFFLLEEARVAMVSGTAFGADNCIRISYATSDDRITEAVRRIKEALAKLV
ncbi:MAG: pyridoxal phosphate-dependent aminotransferase [Bacteroidales bacterium]|jgi:aspartate aminotransferase|nr:pyridoxal phosphate-dependent aminotransferase [Bacteroidales bacterium]MCB9027801.1 pyridoxal phosphate-dependent aminotransferase [Bacteroidales bacterium]MDD3735846.1 pyridoxal phosphate-dependent aminotransferase [Bacteroidales bacterium]NLD63733.1 pyridoxal phosphate-dependent aminotransferase [Bacteroidales bacterium]HOO67071.1 pyridoxal phosphate-dependent aminotransferase [Bacteroidales bacterium]